MKSYKRSILALVPIAALLIPLPVHAIKCWTNKEGIRECGDAVPPEYAQQETRTLNERGFTTEIKKRAKTKEELAEEQRKREEERRREEEEKLRKVRQQAYDRVLLMTFTSEQDIIASRDRKLAAIDATIEITGVTIDKLKDKLAEKQKRAADLERNSKPVPNDLLQEMAHLKKQVAEKYAYVDSKRKEQDALRRKYEADLTRYREITQGY